MANAAFPIHPDLTAIALAFRNQRMIADLVMPRIPVSRQEFKHYKWALGEGFTIPNTNVGRKSLPAEVEFSAIEVLSSCQDYGLDDLLPVEDVMNSIAPIDPAGRAVEGLTDLIMLDREVRVANIMFTLGNYLSTQRITLSGTSQFSDFTNSDPLGVIMAGLDACIMRPNVMVIGRPAFSVLIRNPKVVGAVLGNNGINGIVRREDLAALFELDEVLVGEGFINNAKRGQTVSLARAWGKHISLIWRDPLMNNPMGSRVTFGYTAQWGNRIAGSISEPTLGLRGSERVRVGESVVEVIAANEVGYLIQNAVA